MSLSPDDDADADADDESQWRFGLDDVGDDAEDDDGLTEPDIEPEGVELENVVFVLVGVVGALVILASAL